MDFHSKVGQTFGAIGIATCIIEVVKALLTHQLIWSKMTVIWIARMVYNYVDMINITIVPLLIPGFPQPRKYNFQNKITTFRTEYKRFKGNKSKYVPKSIFYLFNLIDYWHVKRAIQRCCNDTPIKLSKTKETWMINIIYGLVKDLRQAHLLSILGVKLPMICHTLILQYQNGFTILL